MKLTSKLLVFSAVALVFVGALLLLQPALASSLQQSTPSPGNATQTAPTQATPARNAISTALAEVWAQFCAVSQQASYVLVAIPENASFEITEVDGKAITQTQGVSSSPTGTASSTEFITRPNVPSTVTAGDVACTSMGNMDGRQIVLCRGPALKTVTLSIDLNGVTQELRIMPPACVAGFTVPAGATIPTNTVIPTLPTQPVLPTNTPVLPLPSVTPSPTP
jgi:hypothetical protein